MTQQIVLKKGDTLPEVELQVLQASPVNLDITGVDTGNDTVTVQDDWTDTFTEDLSFEVIESTGNNGDYTVSNSSYNSSNDTTTITVNQSVTNSTADGEISFPERIPVNLSGSNVKLYVYNPDNDTQIIDGENMTIVNANLGKVRYKFTSGEVDTTGAFPAEIVATFSDGDLTFPNDGYIPVIINQDVQGGIDN